MDKNKLQSLSVKEARSLTGEQQDAIRKTYGHEFFNTYVMKVADYRNEEVEAGEVEAEEVDGVEVESVNFDE